MKLKALFALMLATGVSTALLGALSAPAEAASLRIHVGFPVFVANDNQSQSWGNGDYDRHGSYDRERAEQERYERERYERARMRAQEFRRDEEQSYGRHEGWGHRR